MERKGQSGFLGGQKKVGNPKPSLRKYLVVGESGAGKSKFIGYLQGNDANGQKPTIGGRGGSETMSTTPYWAQLLEERIILIDTRGTSDTGTTSDQKIIEGIIKTLVCLSLEEQNKTNALDGILYIQSYHQKKDHQVKRIQQLEVNLGIQNLNQSVLKIWTHYNGYIQDSDEDQQEFDKYRSNDSLCWESNPKLKRDNQEGELRDKLNKLKGFNLQQVEQAKQRIYKRAKELQEQDLVDHHKVEKAEKDFKIKIESDTEDLLNAERKDIGQICEEEGEKIVGVGLLGTAGGAAITLVTEAIATPVAVIAGGSCGLLVGAAVGAAYLFHELSQMKFYATKEGICIEHKHQNLPQGAKNIDVKIANQKFNDNPYIQIKHVRAHYKGDQTFQIIINLVQIANILERTTTLEGKVQLDISYYLTGPRHQESQPYLSKATEKIYEEIFNQQN